MQGDFLTNQKKYERVRTAINQKEDLVVKTLKNHGITLEDVNLIFVAYKDNELLDVYAKSMDPIRPVIVSYCYKNNAEVNNDIG